MRLTSTRSLNPTSVRLFDLLHHLTEAETPVPFRSSPGWSASPSVSSFCSNVRTPLTLLHLYRLNRLTDYNDPRHQLHARPALSIRPFPRRVVSAESCPGKELSSFPACVKTSLNLTWLQGIHLCRLQHLQTLCLHLQESAHSPRVPRQSRLCGYEEASVSICSIPEGLTSISCLPRPSISGFLIRFTDCPILPHHRPESRPVV